jgi:alcohol dehydrogenase (cytochrome c)
MYGEDREGDNLYAASLVALDGDSGKLRWHYQFTPHDVWDYDATHVPVLVDLTINGQPRKVLINPNRNGFFYVLDRATGRLILGKPFVKTTWAKAISPDGRPMILPGTNPSEQGTVVCPTVAGGTNYMPPAFNPMLGLFFVTAREGCMTFYAWKTDYVAGESYRSGAGVNNGGEPNYGALQAIDPLTGERKWEFRYSSLSSGGVLSTASGLVFTGDNDGNFMAFDGKGGKVLWHYQLGGAIYAAPNTYMLDGRQYVLMPSSYTLTAFALPDPN